MQHWSQLHKQARYSASVANCLNVNKLTLCLCRRIDVHLGCIFKVRFCCGR